MKRYKVDVLGTLWLPSVTGGTTYEFTADDDEKAVDKVGTIGGDFQEILDFSLHVRVLCPTCCLPHWEKVRDWENEESEYEFLDCMGG